MRRRNLTSRRWFCPVVFALLLAISIWPPITHVAYDLPSTVGVIVTVLMVPIQPYRSWGWVFHVATLAVIALAVSRPRATGRVMAAYLGLTYLLTAALQTNGVPEKQGFAVRTGARVATALLGVLWLWVAWRGRLEVPFEGISTWRWSLLPPCWLALLVPCRSGERQRRPEHRRPHLSTSPDYGLTYAPLGCLSTWESCRRSCC